MTKRHWLILAVVVVVCGLVGAALVVALAVGFFAGHEEAAGADPGLPVYHLNQTNSARAGYLRTTLTCNGELFVNDYEEACLQLATSEPKPAIGRFGIDTANICAIPSQATTAYIAADVGSEMPAYEAFRNVRQPPFDWRTARFHSLFLFPPSKQLRNPKETTNTLLLAEVINTLRDGASVELPAFPFAGTTNLATIKMDSDQLPGLLFCPSVYFDRDGTVYLAESLMMDVNARPTQLHARWIPARPMLAEWLKAP